MVQGWTKERQEKFPEQWTKVKAQLARNGEFAMLGKHQSDHQKEVTRLRSIGKQTTLGKTWKWTDEQREAQRQRKIGKKLPPFTAEHKEKLRQSNIGQKRGPETIAKIKINRARQILPLKDTLPERMVQEELTKRGIAFEKHKPIDGQPDVFIEPNICVFVDGDYWHNRPEAIRRDKITSAILRRKGYRVFRIWEKDIKKSVSDCIDSLCSHHGIAY